MATQDLSLFSEAELRAMLKTLMAAIFQGTREVYYGDKRVVYRSLNEMKSIRDEMQQMLGVCDDTNGGRTYATYNSDLHGNTGYNGPDL